MARLVMILMIAFLLIGCARMTVYRTPQPTGGSKADGTIRLAYEVATVDEAIVDWEAAGRTALARCRAWGYSAVEPFAGVSTACAEYAGFACTRRIIFKDYQCHD